MATSQRQLNPELSQMFESRQSGLEIVKTTTTPSGQILDWIPLESQHPEGKIASPPPADYMAARVEDKLRPTKAAGFELDDRAIERGPEGTVPLVRPVLPSDARTIGVEDYLQKRGGLLVNKNHRNKHASDPSPFGYFHAIDSQNSKVYGCDGYLSVWDPAVNNPAGPGDDHSIMQTWLQNYDKPHLRVLAGN